MAVKSAMFRHLSNYFLNRIEPLLDDKHDGLEVMQSVPKKANDAMHLSLLEGCDVPTNSLGEVVLQESFHVWDLRQIIKKGRERRVFLFDLHLLLAKEVKDSHGKAKYIYKTKFMTSELGVTEHIEGDECKFSVWTGREPMASDCRIVLKAPSLEAKQTWVRRLREVIQETYFNAVLPRSPARVRPTSSQRSSKDIDENLEETSTPDRNSLTSCGSGNTTDSDKGVGELSWVVSEHVAGGAGELSVAKGQQVEVLEPWSRADWWLVRAPGEPPQEGAVPAHVLKPQPTPQTKTSPSRRSLSQPAEEPIEAAASESGVSAASPGKQRRGFSGRWLGGLRKPLKSEKVTGAGPPSAAEKPAPLLKKTPSDKKFKIPFSSDSGRGDDSFDNQNITQGTFEEGEDNDIELPPPMEPIQNPQSVLQQSPEPAPTSVQPTMEQHGGVASSSKGDEVEEATGPGSDSAEAALRKREYVLKELIETEEIYVSDLRLVCEGYMRHMQDNTSEPNMPDSLRDRRRLIFGNIETIYDWHRDSFLPELRHCLTSPERLGPLFRKFLEKRMLMYESYCRNKPVSEYIVSEHEHYFIELRQKLGHKLQLADLLIKPIQRIQKYHLLVQKVLTYSEGGCCPAPVLAALAEAVTCTSIIPKNANDMMDVGRLQGFTMNITSQGKLLLQEPLVCSEASSSGEGRGKELHVFLFEQCIIFSDAVGKKSQFTSPTYNYKAHILVNKMEMEKLDNGAFLLQSTDPNKPRVSYVCRAAEQRRQLWLNTLNSILQSQRMFGDALENPGAYLRELTRDPPHPVA